MRRAAKVAVRRLSHPPNKIATKRHSGAASTVVWALYGAVAAPLKEPDLERGAVLATVP